MKGKVVMGRLVRSVMVFMLITVLAGAIRAADSTVAKAARAGDLTAVRKLTAARADVNIPEGDGTTALLWAAYHSDVEMARVLITAGAKVDAANHYGVTPLLQASRTGDTAMIETLLKSGANPSLAHPEGETPLMAVSRAGRVDAVRLLLERGADVNATESLEQQTALMWAAAEGHLGVVDELLKAGADPNRKARISSLTDRKNADHPTGGFTALMWAARNGREDVAKHLIQAGADVNLTNGDGASAMTIAIVNDRFDHAAMLLDSGANANDGSLYHAVEMHDATTDWYARDGSQLRANHPNKLTALDLVRLLLDDFIAAFDGDPESIAGTVTNLDLPVIGAVLQRHGNTIRTQVHSKIHRGILIRIAVTKATDSILVGHTGGELHITVAGSDRLNRRSAGITPAVACGLRQTVTRH